MVLRFSPAKRLNTRLGQNPPGVLTARLATAHFRADVKNSAGEAPFAVPCRKAMIARAGCHTPGRPFAPLHRYPPRPAFTRDSNGHPMAAWPRGTNAGVHVRVDGGSIIGLSRFRLRLRPVRHPAWFSSRPSLLHLAQGARQASTRLDAATQ